MDKWRDYSCITNLSRLQLASAIRVAALMSRDGILWVQGIPNIKSRSRESIDNAYYRLNKRLSAWYIRYKVCYWRTSDQNVEGVRPVASPPPHKFLQTFFGPKYIRNRPYN